MLHVEGVNELPEEMRTDQRMAGDELRERRTDLHVDVFYAGVRLLHPAEFGRPWNFTRRLERLIDGCRRFHARVIDEEIDIRKILGRLDEVSGVVVFRHR